MGDIVNIGGGSLSTSHSGFFPDYTIDAGARSRTLAYLVIVSLAGWTVQARAGWSADPPLPPVSIQAQHRQQISKGSSGGSIAAASR